ncbi:MAG: hypothetical protein HRO68_10245 [Nitrosopumilus sp.]|nr:hypothetical protein [Nitrosopumilus sp.]
MTTDFKVFFDNESASEEELNQITEIVIEQEVDMAWEAKVKIPITIDQDGNWYTDKDFINMFSRIRIEVKIDENPYVALIDGPIVGYEHSMSTEPGQSYLILKVQDDSIFLNREEKIEIFENTQILQIATQVFQNIPEINSTDIPATQDDPNLQVIVQRGSDIQFLRSLAKTHGVHAYVLPGNFPNQSIGCFKPFPTQTDGLIPFVLLGENRNIASFRVINDGQRPSEFSVSKIDDTNKKTLTYNASFTESKLLGINPTLSEDSSKSLQLLEPWKTTQFTLEHQLKQKQ